ncbi:ribulokinase [Nocardioides sp. Soil774]|nr:ribulokinase [Nocardioides sp. Soil774]
MEPDDLAPPSRPSGRPVAVGVDFGTLSGRAVVVRVEDGRELGSAVADYPHGVLDRSLPSGRRLPPDWALQVPDDYRHVLRTAVPEAIRSAGIDPRDVVGIGTAFTASTVLPTLADGTPLVETHELADEPHAFVKLWKHHAAQRQADLLNRAARERDEPWLARYGGLISSEWQLPKVLQVLQEAPGVHEAAEDWVEAADWIVQQLTGVRVRNAGTAGYKGLHQEGADPSSDFLTAVDPRLMGSTGHRVDVPVLALGQPAGGLTPEAASWTGLPEGTPVAVGTIDAHVAAPAAQATRPGQLLVIMGTSSCHLVSNETLVEVPGMCGVVAGGIVPGLWGYEAGQSAVGDALAWFVSEGVPARYEREAQARGIQVHDLLTELAGEQEIGQHGLVALDWLNGNRSVLVDHHLSGVLVGLTLATRAEDVYRALIEATAFGTRRIVEAFMEAGIAIDELVVGGGLLKNPLVMQIYSNVTGLPLSTVRSGQAAAVGAAIHGAVAAGAHVDLDAAAAAMGGRGETVYRPVPADVARYDELYQHYRELHDHFGEARRDLMHDLRAMRG